MACALDDIATELEAAVEGGKELNDALKDLLPRLFREHMPVVFNGNGYSAEWPEEAARRGLPNLKDTVAALEHYDDPEVMEVFLRNRVLSEPEILARQEILQENYALTVGIELGAGTHAARNRASRDAAGPERSRPSGGGNPRGER